MAKSVRSKWKKAHRRERATAERGNVSRRLKQLHKKLKLTAKGSISGVRTQAPESRFHFVNPELDPHVPNTSEGLNNNYRMEPSRTAHDFSKPLKLAAPKTNFYGKTDADAPHPQTVGYATVDADAPLAGHALSKADMERMAEKLQQQQLQDLAARLETGEEEEEKESGMRSGKPPRRQGKKDTVADEDGPEEFVFGLDDAHPVKITRGSGGGSSSPATGPAALKIASMASPLTRRAKVVAAAGDKKVKKMAKQSVQGSRTQDSTHRKRATRKSAAGSKKAK